MKEKIPVIFFDSISLASSQHNYNTHFSVEQNFSRPAIKTNYGIHTFRYASSRIWESINYDLKQSSSIFIFKKTYSPYLLSQT